MKKIVFVFTFMAVVLFQVFCNGIREKELVNEQEIELDHIDTIEIRYRSDNIAVYNSNSDTFIVKEYMTENNSSYYAKITNSGNKLIVEAGRRPWEIINAFSSRIEVYIPESDKSITIKTSSGRIEAAGDYTALSMNLECSSGSISVNSITADTINFQTSSGSIRCQNTNGSTTINTSSGTIAFSGVSGDAFAKSTSGRIEVDQVSGSLIANTTSGSIRIGAVKGNADIRASSGDIVSGSIGGNVKAETSSGSIKLNMVNGAADARSSSGSIQCAAAENAGNISIVTSSGSVTLDIPRSFEFNFSSRSSSGSLRTPFSDRLFSPLSDRNSIQGVIVSDITSENQIHKNIDIRTGSGSIRVNWIS